MKKILITFLILSVVSIGLFGFFGSADAAWYDGTWNYRIKITIDNTKVDADLTDFPIYVNLDDLPDATFWANVKANCADVRITTSDEVTEVPREIVVCNTGTKTGEMHFKGSPLNATDTVFYIYYGNSAATEPAANATYGSQNVWTSSFQAVYHLQQDPSGNGVDAVLDSTSNAYHTTPFGSPVNGTGKLAGNAITFAAVDDQLKDTDQVWADANNAITVSVWSNFASADTAQQATLFRYTTSGNERNSAHAPWASTDYWDFGTCCTSPGRISGSNTAYDDKYSLFHFTGGANHEIYIDGASRYAAGSSDSPTGALTGFAIGSGIDTEWHKGTLDEFRVATVERTSTWISTEYNNQNSPSTFYSLTAQETPPSTAETSIPIRINNGGIRINNGGIIIK